MVGGGEAVSAVDVAGLLDVARRTAIAGYCRGGEGRGGGGGEGDLEGTQVQTATAAMCAKLNLTALTS